MEQFLRTRGGRQLFGGVKPLVSDSPLSRSLSGFGLAGLPCLLQAVYAAGCCLGVGRGEVGGGRWRIGGIDGSPFGRFGASCFAEIGAVSLMDGLEELPAEDMRELAHWRRDIENNGFKSLNTLVHTKHLYAHDPQVAEAMPLIRFLAGNVLQLCLARISRAELEALFGQRKGTRRFLQQQIRDAGVVLPTPDT